MFKLTVLYNLPEGTNEEEFLAWRTGQHQEENSTMDHVITTDFYRAFETQLGTPRYRFITEAYFESLEKLNASFFSEESQAKLKKDSAGMTDSIFIVSERLAFTDNQES